MTNSPSDETLNAFVDGELGRRDCEDLLAASCGDAVLRQRVAELQGVRALVRHAYGQAPFAAGPALAGSDISKGRGGGRPGRNSCARLLERVFGIEMQSLARRACARFRRGV